MQIRRTCQEKDVIALLSASYMTEYNCTLWTISGLIECPMSSLYKIMMERLPHLDHSLYERVRDRLEEHKRNGRRKVNGTVPM